MSETKFIINGKELTYHKNDDHYELPPIISSDKLHRKTTWKIWVDHDSVNDTVRIGSSSQIGENGKISVSYVEIREGKNIGRSNQTTPLQQALCEAYAKYIKKKDLSRSIEEDEKEEVAESKPLLPMLCQKYEERGEKYLTLPFGVSAKLDGVRMISQPIPSICGWGSLSIRLYSRTGKAFFNLQRIRSDLRILYQGSSDPYLQCDGECYSHELFFNQISGATRSKTVSEYDDKMQYWIFDLIQEEVPYEHRMIELKRLADMYHLKVPENERTLRFVYYEIVNDHSEVEAFHTKYVSEGYEGVILRNLNGMYLVKNRSNDCQKYKHFQDEEYEICGYKSGKGIDENAIIFKCKTTKGGEFDCRMRGTIEHRRELYTVGSTLIGKQLTVRYQEKDVVSSVPRFPVGICIRDYE